ncbi:MAG: hypothetical protein JNJ85_05825 [Candidatus Kapabacteria bacterium]|nr:hypothetical protein [Candidatus Kapabacteria bacterium]
MKAQLINDSKQNQTIQQSNIYNHLQSWYLLLTIIVLFTCNTNAQTVVQLSPRVGKEIQYSDLRYFGLFSTIDNGQTATITKTDSVYKVQITCPEMPDTTLVLTTPEFTELQQYVNTYESILYDDYVLHYKLIQPFTHYVQYSEPGENITITTIDGKVHTKKLLYANDEYIVLKTTSEYIDINKDVSSQVRIFSYNEIASIGTNTFKYTGTLSGLSFALLDNTMMNSDLNKSVYRHYEVSSKFSQVFKVAVGVCTDLLNKHAYTVVGKQSSFISAIEKFRKNTLCPQQSSGVMPELQKEMILHKASTFTLDSITTTSITKPSFTFNVSSPISFISSLTDSTRIAGDTLPISMNTDLTLNLFSCVGMLAIDNNLQLGFRYNFFKEVSGSGFTSEKSIPGYAECRNFNALLQYTPFMETQYQYNMIEYNIGVQFGVGSIGNNSTHESFFDLGLNTSIDFRPIPNLTFNFDMFLQRNFFSKTLIISFIPSNSNQLQYRTPNNFIYGVCINTGICL